MLVNNPVLAGFYPDPSVVSANRKYYMVCSSFQFFPGVPLFESEDLINWKQIGYCLTRKSQVDLHKITSSGGVFAPTIRFHEGRFYMVTTNDTYHKNFFVYTDDIYGEWSEPVFVDQGGIDPSLFFEDGKTYFMSNGSDEDGKGCIFQCEINPVTGEKLTESKPIWKGNGGRYLESPHLYHFGDWYYVMAAEGGTEYGHMITYARGKSPYGPFTSYAQNPVLTNRNLGGHESRVQGIGHGDLVQDKDGNTYILCLGFRQEGTWVPYHHLGREVFIAPVQWQEDGWFTAGDHGIVKAQVELPIQAKPQESGRYDVSFETEGKDSLRWCYMREPEMSHFQFTEHGLNIKGNPLTLDAVDAPDFIGIRQAEFDTELQVTVGGKAAEAGITFYMDECHRYDLALVQNQGRKQVILRLTTGDAQMVAQTVTLAPIEEDVQLRVTSDGERYYFSVVTVAGKEEMGTARTKYLSSEVAGGFTGTVMGMYAVNPDDADDKWAEFSELNWKQKPWSELTVK